jgi:hypothetical protein
MRATTARLPILIRIAELAEHIRACRHRREGPPQPPRPGWLPHWLAARSTEFGWGLDAPFFERKLKSGEAAVLLDGLDEAPNRTEREAMARLLENATRAYDKCSFVVTTRPLAYQGQAVLADFETANIAPLEPQAIETFLQRWCGALFSENPASSASHLAELSGALRARAEIRRMARNPVMLTALAVVHWNERRLPEQRADLYESILIWLARSREQRPDRPTAERCLMLLQQLALAMQNAPKGRAVQVSKGWAADALAPHFREVPEPERKQRAQDFLEQEEVDSGIIVSRASEIAFRHLTFQEYLAAKAIAGMPDAAQQDSCWQSEYDLQAGMARSGPAAGRRAVPQGPEKVDGLVSAILEKLGRRGRSAQEARCARAAWGHRARPAPVPLPTRGPTLPADHGRGAGHLRCGQSVRHRIPGAAGGGRGAGPGRRSAPAPGQLGHDQGGGPAPEAISDRALSGHRGRVPPFRGGRRIPKRALVACRRVRGKHRAPRLGRAVAASQPASDRRELVEAAAYCAWDGVRLPSRCGVGARGAWA